MSLGMKRLLYFIGLIVSAGVFAALIPDMAAEDTPFWKSMLFGAVLLTMLRCSFGYCMADFTILRVNNLIADLEKQRREGEESS